MPWGLRYMIMKRFFVLTVAALVTLAIGLNFNDFFNPKKPVDPPIEPVSFLLMPQQHVLVHDTGGNGRPARFELVGMKPTLEKSPLIKVLPKLKKEGSVFVFSKRKLEVQNSTVTDKVTLQVAGTFTKTVIIKVPEGIPVFYGKKADPPRK